MRVSGILMPRIRVSRIVMAGIVHVSVRIARVMVSLSIVVRSHLACVSRGGMVGGMVRRLPGIRVAVSIVRHERVCRIVTWATRNKGNLVLLASWVVARVSWIVPRVHAWIRICPVRTIASRTGRPAMP
jgi:hypothetical protein